jgi:thiamine biosynthesis lipoprotein
LPGGAWRSIRVDAHQRTVTLPIGAALDFGGIAKGMAVDAALEALIAAGISPVAVEAGGDLRVHGLPTGQTDWPVAVNLLEGNETIALLRGALATSSRARRCWQRGGLTVHHILDPRSGMPAETGIWSVTVAAARCTQADVAAKAAFILGPGAGRGFLVRHRLAALIVLESGGRQPVGAWPQPGARGAA